MSKLLALSNTTTYELHHTQSYNMYDTRRTKIQERSCSSSCGYCTLRPPSSYSC